MKIKQIKLKYFLLTLNEFLEFWKCIKAWVSNFHTDLVSNFKSFNALFNSQCLDQSFFLEKRHAHMWKTFFLTLYYLPYLVKIYTLISLESYYTIRTSKDRTTDRYYHRQCQIRSLIKERNDKKTRSFLLSTQEISNCNKCL